MCAPLGFVGDYFGTFIRGFKIMVNKFLNIFNILLL